MDLGALDLIKGLTAKMGWLTQRQNVVAQNIANIDTPNYQALDLSPFDFKTTLKRQLAPEQTSAMHLAGFNGSADGTRADKERQPYEVTPSGNSVSLEEQMRKSAQTGIDFQMITNLYRKNIGLIVTALGKGSSNS